MFIDWQNYSCEDTGTTNAMGRACAISIRVSMALLFGSRKTHCGGGGASMKCLQEKVLATKSDTLNLSPVESQQSPALLTSSQDSVRWPQSSERDLENFWPRRSQNELTPAAPVVALYRPAFILMALF